MHYPEQPREQFQNLIVDVYVDHVCTTDAHLTIAGHLRRCTDILPGGDCETMDMPRGSTYAQADRQVKQDIPRLRRHWEQDQGNRRDHASAPLPPLLQEMESLEGRGYIADNKQRRL